MHFGHIGDSVVWSGDGIPMRLHHPYPAVLRLGIAQVSDFCLRLFRGRFPDTFYIMRRCQWGRCDSYRPNGALPRR